VEHSDPKVTKISDQYRVLLTNPRCIGKLLGQHLRASHLIAHLIAYWEDGQDEAWFILTDLPPFVLPLVGGTTDVSNACWYGMRAWIEHGFKHTKREGFGWHRTRMESSRHYPPFHILQASLSVNAQ